MKPAHVGASVRQRLLNLSQAKGWVFNRVLTRYGVERILFRITPGRHRAKACLGVVLTQCHVGPFLDQFVEADPLLLGQPPKALMFRVRNSNRHRAHANDRLALLGVILCAVPRPKTRLARELVAYVERTCVDSDGRTLKFASEISRSVAVQEAQKAGTTIFQHQGDHPVADEYRALAGEFEERLLARRKAQ